MNEPDAIDLLNRLLAIVYRSLPRYLEGMRPQVSRGEEKLWQLLSGIAADDRHYAEEIALAIQEAGGLVDPGQYPASFTGLHDVSLDFLFTRVVELKRRDLRCIEQCAAALSWNVRYRSLADEVLGNARGHLEMLEEAGGESSQ